VILVRKRNVLNITIICCIIAISAITINRLYAYIYKENYVEKDNNKIAIDSSLDKDETILEQNNEKIIKDNKDINNEYKNNKPTDKVDISEIEPIASSKNNKKIVPVDTIKEPKIMSSTRIEYQNYYTEDDKLEVAEEVEPPYYMINLTREQVEEFYPEYQLMSFSSERVILRKVFNERSHKYYIIKEFNDNVGVFYDYRNEEPNINIEDYLRDTIDMQVSGLVMEEQQKLNNGIIVYGEEELTEILKKLRKLYKLNESGIYIVKQYNDLLGIFYDYTKDENYSANLNEQELNNLLEKYLRKVIETPVLGLEEELMNQLKEGITVNGEEELIRLLENYTS
jgi:hypothetical protein